MIECLFTIDYEVYGNGSGSLRELVYEPTERLANLFASARAHFVPYVEVAELEAIAAAGTDEAITLVEAQIRALRRAGCSPALHLHPQWFNAVHTEGGWQLDYREYNLCTLPESRIVHMVDRSIAYLRRVLKEPEFTPFAFRAGNWLFQPTQRAAAVLADRGVRVDSSVFKGGLRHEHGLDYRRAPGEDYYWRFSVDVDVVAPNGPLLEIPIYTRQVPIWKMVSGKRLALERQSTAGSRNPRRLVNRLRDHLRMIQPLKLDFCRMTAEEMIETVDKVRREDMQSPSVFRPLVAIGHTKELRDFDSIARFLRYLGETGLAVSTFEDVYARCV